VGQPLVSVVFSFRNEEAVLEELVRRTASALKNAGAEFEIVLVNDDSSDGSLALLERMRKDESRIKVLTTSRRFGVAECLRAGLAHATGEAIVFLDADLQDPPELIPELIAKWRGGADVVHPVRQRRLGESPLKMAFTRLAYRVIGSISRIELPVDAGDFKLLSRRAVQHLLALDETDPYIRGLAVWIGFPQATVEYLREARAGGITHFPIWSVNPWRTLVSGLTSFSFVPIYLIAAAGLAGLVVTAAVTLFHGLGIVPLLLFCWSTLLLAVGTVGIYIVRIYKDVRRRPAYILREKLGFD
jgi:glycosyltransferase involved in cell wall biosynthesis